MTEPMITLGDLLEILSTDLTPTEIEEPMITLGDLLEILSTDLTPTEIEAFLYEWGIA